MTTANHSIILKNIFVSFYYKLTIQLFPNYLTASESLGCKHVRGRSFDCKSIACPLYLIISKKITCEKNENINQVKKKKKPLYSIIEYYKEEYPPHCHTTILTYRVLPPFFEDNHGYLHTFYLYRQYNALFEYEKKITR